MPCYFQLPEARQKASSVPLLVLLLKVGAKCPSLELLSRLETQLGKEETGKTRIESEPQRLGTPGQGKSLSHGAPVLVTQVEVTAWDLCVTHHSM